MTQAVTALGRWCVSLGQVATLAGSTSGKVHHVITRRTLAPRLDDSEKARIL